MQLYQQGLIQPIAPITTYSSQSILEAFRYMQRAQHIGKIVITMPEEVEELYASPARKTLHLEPDYAYLLVGGLGGLGRSISTWLAEHGARQLVFLSRSADRISDNDPFLQELSSLGCTFHLVAGDVTEYKDVVKALRIAKTPIKGVLQASMVLRVSAISVSRKCPFPASNYL